MNPARKALLETRDGWEIGRDPRQVSRDELIAAGHKPMSPLKALRARCLDCCAGQSSAIRRCEHMSCPSWPFRMATNPWQAPLSEQVLEARRRGGRKRAASVEKPAQGVACRAERALPAPHLPAEPPLRRKAGSEQDFQTTGETAMDEETS